MGKYSGNDTGNMSVQVKDYQPSSKEFAGVMPGKTTDYISRTEKDMNKDAGRIRNQAYKGRYE